MLGYASNIRYSIISITSVSYTHLLRLHPLVIHPLTLTDMAKRSSKTAAQQCRYYEVEMCIRDRVAGGKRVDTLLLRPVTELGYYRDIAVLAFPSFKNGSYQGR